MKVVRYLLVGLMICVTACSKKHAVPTAEPAQPVQPAIQAGSLRAPYVRFEFAIYYLPIPLEDPMQSLDEILASDFSGLDRVEELEKQPARPSVAARLLPSAESHQHICASLRRAPEGQHAVPRGV